MVGSHWVRSFFVVVLFVALAGGLFWWYKSRFAVETPENIDVILVPAGVWVRCVAFLVDFAIRFAVYFACAVVYLGFKFGFVEGFLLLLLFFLEWFYGVFFEVFNDGMTPGKKVVGLQVVHADGTPISWSSSILRNFLRVVDWLPFGYVAGLVSMVCCRHFQRLGDLAAGSLVVYVSKPASFVSEGIEGVHLPMRLSRDEQQAFVSFAERQSSLSVGRQHELVGILEPVLGVGGQAGVDKAVAVAHGVLSTR